MQALLVNPPMYDVSAYGFWSAPLGLLYLGSILRENGLEIGLIDCLKERDEKRGEDGRAPFVKERVSNPEAARFVAKRFRRYGFSREETGAKLGATAPPDLVLVTGMMTYWYQGVSEVVELVEGDLPIDQDRGGRRVRVPLPRTRRKTHGHGRPDSGEGWVGGVLRLRRGKLRKETEDQTRGRRYQ